jgi:preprotein translocase subunit SecA
MSEEELEAQQRAYEREAMERLRYADNSAPSELSAGGGVLRNTPRPAVQSQMEKMRQKHEEQAAESLNQAFSGASRSNGSSTQGTVVRQAPKVGRNDPCPCGSGKKYKKCHGS